MPETVAASAKWDYDYIPEYNLSEKIIGGYLKEIWGNYKYFVEVSHTIAGYVRKDRFGRHQRLTPSTLSAPVMIFGSGCLAGSIRYVNVVLYACGSGYPHNDPCTG